MKVTIEVLAPRSELRNKVFALLAQALLVSPLYELDPRVEAVDLRVEPGEEAVRLEATLAGPPLPKDVPSPAEEGEWTYKII